VLRNYFGKQDPIGKTITHYGDDYHKFCGNGHFAKCASEFPDAIRCVDSFSSIYQPWMFNNWGGNWLDTYFELAPNTNIAALEKKFPAYLKKYMAERGNWKNYELFLFR
jgi:putative ABC transport system permease protein